MDGERSDRQARLIEAYGVDRARWPEDERGAGTGEAPLVFAEGREIDRILAHASNPAPKAAARAAALSRIMAATGTPGRRGNGGLGTRRSWGTWAPAATALAASFALGIYLGAAGVVDTYMPTGSFGTDTAMIQEDVDVTGVSDLSELIEGSSS
jgi:hypothetical protein